MRSRGFVAVSAQVARLLLCASTILGVMSLLLGASVAFAPRASAAPKALVSTTTTVTSSPNPSVYGQNVTFTIKVASASGTPTGKVTLLDNSYLNSPSNEFAILTLDANGQATISSARLFPGTHTMVAQYAGDSTFQASTSATQDQVISKTGTATTLASSLNPSSVGQVVTYRVTVTSAGSDVPSGTVTLKDRSTPVGSPVTLDPGGKALIQVSSLSVGTHRLTATFTPDLASNKFVSPSTSAILSQEITVIATPIVSSGSGNAYVRIVQSSEAYPTSDIYIDGKVTFPNVAACATRMYFPIAAGTHTFAVAAPSGGAMVMTKSLTLTAGVYYTLAVATTSAQSAAPALLAFTDDNTVTPNQAKVRVYALSASLDGAQVQAGGTLVSPSLAFGSATSYHAQSVGMAFYSFQRGSGRGINDVLNVSPNLVYSVFLMCGHTMNAAASGILVVPPVATSTPTTPVVHFSSSALTPQSVVLPLIVSLLALLVGAAGGYALGRRKRTAR